MLYQTRKMAVEVFRLNSGFDMPVIGLGTWLVCNLIVSQAWFMFMYI